MGKYIHSKVMGFFHTSCVALIHAISKTWGGWIPMLREKYEKAQTFQSYGFFLTHFTWNINPSIHKPWMNSHITEQVWENTGNSLLYPTDLELMKTHAIPNVWECTNSHNMEIFCGKPYHSQVVGFWRNLGIFVWVHGR